MLVQVPKRIGCYERAARNLRASCLRRQSAKKPARNPEKQLIFARILYAPLMRPFL
jgi:hypothetical protein